MSLRAYLQAQKQAFLALPSSPPRSLTLVSGNESGDLDSLVCALSVGYILGRETFPLLQTRAKDIVLRPENILALQTAGVQEDDVLNLDDVEKTLVQLKGAEVKVILVDHNRLTPNLTQFNPEVIGVVDHHVDEGLYKNASPRVIYPPQECGSCSSLVTRAYRQGWLKKTQDITPEVARLLLSASLIDTHNFDPQIGKAKEVDHESGEFLSNLARVPLTSNPGVTVSALALKENPSQSIDGTSLHDALSQAKNDVSRLNTLQLLTRDYKQYTFPSLGRKWEVGLGTVPEPLESWIKREGKSKFVDGCRAFSAERKLDLLGILTSFEAAGEFQREVAIFAPNRSAAFESFAQTAEEDTKEVLELVPLDHLNEQLKGDNFVVWQQRQTRSTRKQVAPAFEEVAAKVSLE